MMKVGLPLALSGLWASNKSDKVSPYTARRLINSHLAPETERVVVGKSQSGYDHREMSQVCLFVCV